MRRREKIKFKIGRESARGIIGLVLSVLVFIATIVLVIIAIEAAGETGKVVAAVAVIINFVAIIGFILALRALYIKDVNIGIPIAALSLNGITILFYIFIYILGF